ncbi:FxLD family lanthipeptide [Streptomyces hygroscopicus]|uniref:FxLD family lanthipeptide n=1 Tax=Streptomyces hygroscopicus TaxID=1912 RepID=UPI001FCA6F1C|nr:FxLD family lanthipeptide [Streptomyces hygroscopicus]BDH12841.1 hypothetical protein HOK021_40200 [Streptomyces hygroscopicus]
MTAVHTEKPVAPAQPTLGTLDDADPFGLDISFIEGTPATETVLMCSTGDTCAAPAPAPAPPRKPGQLGSAGRTGVPVRPAPRLPRTEW